MNKKEYEIDLFQRILSVMKTHGLTEIAESVILTGSFGRDEATYTGDEENVELKSDIEIAIVYKSGKKRALAFIESVTKCFDEELNCMPLSKKRIQRGDNFNYTLFSQKKKSLFMYDLMNGSKTLWGHEYLTHGKIILSQVDLYEAKRLIANRIGELIFVQQNHPEDADRWKAKLVTAIGTAYLLLNGGYHPSYRKQMEELKRYCAQGKRVISNEFIQYYYQAFSFLRENGAVFNIEGHLLRNFVEKAVEMFQQNHIDRPKINCLSRKLKYGIRYLRCGGRGNLFQIEENIINTLLCVFTEDSGDIQRVAALWHEVLY